MKVHWCCGYYSDYAVRVTGVKRPRQPPFWESYMFCWAVKSGEYHRDFYIMKSDGRLVITKDNFQLVRPTFGEWAAKTIATFGESSLHLVPVPNTEALADVETYRTLKLAEEAFKGTKYETWVLDGLRWNKQRQKGHEGGSRKREELLPLLDAKPVVEGKNIVLVDEIVTTGGNLLACQDRLVTAGAKVIGAVVCGRAVYNLEDQPFGAHSFDLTTQLQDYC